MHACAAALFHQLTDSCLAALRQGRAQQSSRFRIRVPSIQEDKCDIKALIEFEAVDKGEKGTLNALRFNILVEDV